MNIVRENDVLRYTRFHHCPRCGARPVEAFRDNAMQCRDCGFVYFHNCASCAAAIIVVPKGIVFTVRNHAPKKGKLDLPGGFCNYGESLEDTLVREVREEINISLSTILYFGSFPNVYHFGGVTYFTTDAVFLCRCTNISSAVTNDEVAAIKVFRPSDIDPARIGFSSTRAALTRYAERKGKNGERHGAVRKAPTHNTPFLSSRTDLTHSPSHPMHSAVSACRPTRKRPF